MSDRKEEFEVPMSLKVAATAKATGTVLATGALFGLAPAILVGSGLVAVFCILQSAVED